MNVHEAAARLGISTAAVRALVRSGVLPHYQPTLNKRKVVLDPADVEAHYKASRREGSAEPAFELTEVMLDCPAPFSRHPERYRAGKGKA